LIGQNMQIQSAERIKYSHNPLAEVICQLRFADQIDLSKGVDESIVEQCHAAGYSEFSEETAFNVTIEVSHEPTVGMEPRSSSAAMRSFRFSTSDGHWQLVLFHDSLSLVCTNYSAWEDFLPRLVDAVGMFSRAYPGLVSNRLGLRYKDLIEREPLGLDGVPWCELIEPFMLGPLALGSLADGQKTEDAHVGLFVCQTAIRLDICNLVLQSSLLRSTDLAKVAFLIDADFFHDQDVSDELFVNSDVLVTQIEALHKSAGALFRRSITEKLHNALSPISI